MTIQATDVELADGEAAADPMVRPTGGPPWWARAWEARPVTVFVLSLASGLIVSSILIVASVKTSRSAWSSVFSSPGHALSQSGSTLGKAYGALLTGSLASPGTFGHAFAHSSALNWSNAFTPISNTVLATVPLLFCGLGLSIAYRSGVFSIGAQSQLIGGGILASWVGFSWPGLTTPIHVAAGLIAGVLGGALLGAVPAILKVTTGASEVISTIMLNYVMGNLLVYLVSNTFFSKQRNTAPVGRITVPSGSLPLLFGSRLPIDIGLIFAVGAVVFVWAFMSKSRIGFELELSGASPGASITGGINRTKTFVTAFMVSGGVIGLAGGIEILGNQRQLTSGFGANIGVLAIAVAFVGRNRPIGIVFAAILYGVLETGGLKMQGATSISYQLSNVIESIIVLFMVAPALVAELYHLRATRGGLRTLNMSRGWGK